MAGDDHLCPFGLQAKSLLERRGIEVTDHPLTSREEVDAFKAKHGVRTTPQIWLDGVRVGGYEGLQDALGIDRLKAGETTYRPVIALFAMAFAMAGAIAITATGTLFTPHIFGWFIASAMCLLALQKLQDVEKFATMFLSYDLLARRWVPYGKIYPYAEGTAGVLMLAGVLTWLSVPIALVIGGIGAASVFKAVYLDKRELKCACVGGDSNVPLGFVSLLENVLMVGMALWMAGKAFLV
ncbi:MAG: glutaredoxin [Pseudomonadota bacterium]